MRVFFYIIIATAVLSACSQQKKEEQSPDEIFKTSLQQAVKQYKAMHRRVPDTLFPQTVENDSALVTSNSQWWTSGFFPGALWFLYEFSGSDTVKNMAIARSQAVEQEKLNDYDHDIGFKIYCPFGNGYRFTGNEDYLPVMETAAKTLITRYDKDVGCIRSWGKTSDTLNPFKVIVDNMMNLELLFWATEYTGDSTFFDIATSHADTTMKHHYRPDGSSFHVVEYDANTGEVLQKKTAQGYSDTSAWARGQAWGLYGYTMAYRETGFQRYLDHANDIADFYLNHKNLPEDKIPYWDFNAPDIPNALRDASAAAITASALLELTNYASSDSLSEFYHDNARKMLVSLSSDKYRNDFGENFNFLLKHGVGNIPNDSEVDVPLSYADYYYIEGMMRYLGQIKPEQN